MRHAGTSARQFRPRRAAVSALLVAACAAAAFAQTGPRVVVESVTFPTYPVELVGVDVAGKTHEFAEGQPRQLLASFDAGEGWLRQLAFKIRNRSDKAILTVTLYGWLGTGEGGEIPMGIEALYGREMDESAFTGRAPRGEPRTLAPGETAEVRWSSDEYESMARFLSTKRPLAAYRRMRIDLREARFEDGTVWSMGRLYRIDPLDPRKWDPLDGRPARGGPSPDLKAGERIVEVDPRMASAPDDSDALAVTEIRVNGQSVTLGRPFAAGADWLRSLTVRVRNDSAKPIASAQINFSLPEARYHAGGIGFTFRYGSRTVGGQAVKPGAKPPLLPGEEAELSFADGEYEGSRSFAEREGGVAEISRVSVGTASVVFADGTRAFVSKPVRALKPTAPGGTK